MIAPMVGSVEDAAISVAPMFNDKIDLFIGDNINAGWQYLKARTGIKVKDLQRRATELGLSKDVSIRGITPQELADGIGYPLDFVLGEIRSKRLRVNTFKSKVQKENPTVSVVTAMSIREWVAKYFPVDLARVEKAGGREWFCDILIGGSHGTGIAGDATDTPGQDEDGL